MRPLRFDVLREPDLLLFDESGRPRDVLDHPKEERTQAFLRRLLEV